mgnify:CR=1 FL=1
MIPKSLYFDILKIKILFLYKIIGDIVDNIKILQYLLNFLLYIFLIFSIFTILIFTKLLFLKFVLQ